MVQMPWSSKQDTNVIDAFEQLSTSSNTASAPITDEKHPTHVTDLSVAAEDLPKIAKSHQYDPNLPIETLDAIHEAAKTGDPEKILEVEADFTENSPYEEVRAAVRTTDNPDEVANTVRAWVLGMIFVTLGSGLYVPNFSAKELETFSETFFPPVGPQRSNLTPRSCRNMFLSMRSPAINFPSIVVQL